MSSSRLAAAGAGLAGRTTRCPHARVPEATPKATKLPPKPSPGTRVPAAPEIAPLHVSEGLQLVEALPSPSAAEGPRSSRCHAAVERLLGYDRGRSDLHLPDASPPELADVATIPGRSPTGGRRFRCKREDQRSATVAAPEAQALEHDRPQMDGQQPIDLHEAAEALDAGQAWWWSASRRSRRGSKGAHAVR